MPTLANQPHRGVNLFYLILAILFGLANLFAYAVWWPLDPQKPVAVVDAPTVITDHPKDQVLAIQTTVGTSTILPTPQSSSTVLALIKDDAISTAPAKQVGESAAETESTIQKSTASVDRLSPTTPGGLIVRAASYNQVVISWNPSTDNRGVAGYSIYENSKLIGTTIKTLQGFIHLTPSTNYTLGVAAFDSAGNSSRINNILVATPEKPSAPVAVVPTPAQLPPPPPSPLAEIIPDQLPPPPPPPPSLCGNGVQDRGEECDDGNTSDNDMCTNECKAARCMDGIVNYILEQCDDGNEVANDYCDNQCHNHVPILPTPAATPDPSPAPTPSPTPPAPAGSFTLTASVTGSGNISSSPAGITCGSSCSASFTSGTVITLTAAANSGASFTSWGGACTGSGTTCTVTMSASKSVTATFTTVAPVTQTINVTSAGVYSPTTVNLKVGDSIRILYTTPYGAEVITVFTPNPPTQVTVDSSIHSRTVLFSTAGTWTFTAKDHAGTNKGTIIVQ